MATKGRTIICLFRNDLRYHDNEVLYWAYQNADHVLPLYCFDPRHFQTTHHFKFSKTGPFRLKFLLESVTDLRATLKKVGSGLIVRMGEPEVVVPSLVEKLGKQNVQAVVLQEEVTKEELDVEMSLVKNLPGISIKKIWGATLHHKAYIPFKPTNVPDVFSEFCKRVEASSPVKKTIMMPNSFKPLPEGVDEGEIPSIESLGQKMPANDDRTAFPFPGGETSGLERVQQYFWGSDAVATYKQTRNGLVGSEYSTKFSPWLAHGCLSPRKIYEELKKYESERTANNSTYWVVFELMWRDYFRFVAMKYGNRIFYLSGINGVHIPWKQDKRLFEAWKTGNTGVPFVDANMRELNATGFMSNRGRQNVASFLAKDLGLDWRLGAEYFEYVLVDHDVCSNYGNWLYTAGVGNDPRQHRKFNMVKQGLDYDPEGDYVRLWVPELKGLKDGSVHFPWSLSTETLQRAGVRLGETYPPPIMKAPEWSRHTNRVQSGGGGKKPCNRGNKRGGGKGAGRGQGEPRRNQRGIDYYFSSNQR